MHDRSASPPPPPTADVDDSYRGLPVASMENSREGLNRKLASAAKFDSTEPSDFAFLFQNAAKVANETCEEVLASTPSRKWQPNAAAPEFIPTLTMPCPLISVLSSTLSGIESASHSKFIGQGDFSTPQKCAGESRRRTGPSRKRRPSSLQEPSDKRTKSEERQEPEAPRAGQNEMPEVSEAEWQHRIHMRQQAIDIGKKTPEYAAAKLRGKLEGNEPTTPDPRDRTKSKRRWKYDVKQWRSEIAERCLQTRGCGDHPLAESSEGST